MRRAMLQCVRARSCSAAVARAHMMSGVVAGRSDSRHVTTTAAAAATAAAAPQPGDGSSAASSEKEVTSLLVLGGNGFVGSATCAAAVAAGLSVSSYSRSGMPAWVQALSETERDGHWSSQVQWLSGDVFDHAQLAEAMPAGGAVVSSIGAFGSHEFMLRMNGEATVGAVSVAQRSDVARFVFISAHDYGSPVRQLVPGYFDGKYAAEAAVSDAFGEDAGISLRCSALFGPRKVGTTTIPLQLLGVPLRAAGGLLPAPVQSVPLLNLVAVKWLQVEEVAAAAVKAAISSGVRGPLLSVDQIAELAAAAAEPP
jgi:nucleoside-diphosphate-sugar epimerase